MNELDTPLLSVVIPWHDDPRLRRALQQFGSESMNGHVELIVVNDGSSDALSDEARCWVSELQDARILDLSENVGPGIARNLGLEHAKGRSVAFLDSDDIVNADRLLEMADLLQKSGADLAVGGFTIFDQSASRYFAAPKLSQSTESPLARALFAYPAIWRYVFEREFLLRNHMQFPRLRYAEDLLFLLRILDVNPKAIYFDKSVYTHILSAEGAGLAKRALDSVEVSEVLAQLRILCGSASGRDVQVLCQYWALLVLGRQARRDLSAALRVMREPAAIPRPMRGVSVRALIAALRRRIKHSPSH